MVLIKVFLLFYRSYFNDAQRYQSECWEQIRIEKVLEVETESELRKCSRKCTMSTFVKLFVVWGPANLSITLNLVFIKRNDNLLCQPISRLKAAVHRIRFRQKSSVFGKLEWRTSLKFALNHYPTSPVKSVEP